MKKTLFLTGAVWLVLFAAERSTAVTLTTVPLGGSSMVHVNILYNATGNRLEVSVEGVVPQMKPLDVSNPADNFSRGDPWFTLLDPSQEGRAFNRQYGFVMDAGSDPVPANVGIWVRLLSRTPGLGLYRYRSTEPKAWEPIFGTAGSTNLWQWNFSMFHPSAAAPPTNGSHSASFEAFAVDLNTGEPLPGFAPAPFTLDWTIVPSARPLLRLGADCVLCWPATATNYVLQCADAAPTGIWTTMTNTPVVQGGECRLPVDASSASQFYRLKRIP